MLGEGKAALVLIFSWYSPSPVLKCSIKARTNEQAACSAGHTALFECAIKAYGKVFFLFSFLNRKRFYVCYVLVHCCFPLSGSYWKTLRCYLQGTRSHTHWSTKSSSASKPLLITAPRKLSPMPSRIWSASCPSWRRDSGYVCFFLTVTCLHTLTKGSVGVS